MTDPTLAALSAAIAAHPDEDTPREQYKDRLQELADEGDEGARARLEFCRVQEELQQEECTLQFFHTQVMTERLAKMSHLERNGNRDVLSSAAYPEAWLRHKAHLDRRQALRKRERELLAAHEHEWRRTGVCEACGGEGRCEDWKSHTSSLCLTCGGTGDVGGLLLPPLPSQVLNTGEHWRHRVDFVRGHVTTVYAALAEVFERRSEVCFGCGGTGRTSSIGGSCAVCRRHGTLGEGTGLTQGDWHPTARALAWVRAWVRAFPVAGVILTDCQPDESGGWWGWCPDLDAPEMPASLYDALEGACIRNHVVTMSYDYRTRDLAIAALSRAVAQVLRAHVAREVIA